MNTLPHIIDADGHPLSQTESEDVRNATAKVIGKFIRHYWSSGFSQPGLQPTPPFQSLIDFVVDNNPIFDRIFIASRCENDSLNRQIDNLLNSTTNDRQLFKQSILDGAAVLSCKDEFKDYRFNVLNNMTNDWVDYTSFTAEDYRFNEATIASAHARIAELRADRYDLPKPYESAVLADLAQIRVMPDSAFKLGSRALQAQIISHI